MSYEEKGSGPVLSVSGLSFGYPDRPQVLKDIDLKVFPGERVGVIGPNGAGKTTLFLLICGLLKPAGGEIKLFEKPVVPGGFYPEAGLVFQNPDDQLFCPSVGEDVAFGPRNLGLTGKKLEDRVDEALHTAGISQLADKPPHHLSGGEKRMVSIAGVMAMQPQMIIYDEPTSNLDIRYRRRLIDFLQAGSETMLIASHDLEFILEVCSRVILLDRTALMADGIPREVMNDAQLMETHGLERPYSLRKT